MNSYLTVLLQGDKGDTGIMGDTGPLGMMVHQQITLLTMNSKLVVFVPFPWLFKAH